MPTSRISERSSGKMPTTSVRRPISLLKRSSGLVLRSLDQCGCRERVEGEDVLLGVGEHGGDLRQPLVERRDCLARAARAPARPSRPRRSAGSARPAGRAGPCGRGRGSPLRKCTVQRCQGQRSSLAIAALSPSSGASKRPAAHRSGRARSASAPSRSKTPPSLTRQRRCRGSRGGPTRARRRRSPRTCSRRGRRP